IIIIPSPRFETAFISPLKTAFTDPPDDGVEMVMPGLSIERPPTTLDPNGILTTPLSTGQGKPPLFFSKLAASAFWPSLRLKYSFLAADLVVVLEAPVFAVVVFAVARDFFLSSSTMRRIIAAIW